MRDIIRTVCILAGIAIIIPIVMIIFWVYITSIIRIFNYWGLV